MSGYKYEVGINTIHKMVVPFYGGALPNFPSPCIVTSIEIFHYRKLVKILEKSKNHFLISHNLNNLFISIFF